MTDRNPSPAGYSVVAWTALIQTFLLAFCWIALGLLDARGSWLLAAPQAARALYLFRMPLPVLGFVGAVLVPCFFAARLVREAGHPGLLDREFLASALRLPSRAAFSGLVTSVLAFDIAAFHLRRVFAIPAIEAAKIASLGLLTGTLLSVLSYFALQPLVRRMVDEALERGALPSEVPSFPIRKKVLACSLAMAAIMAGLFGLQTLAWSQRYVEQRALADARDFVSKIVADSHAGAPQSLAAWRALLRSRPRAPHSVAYATGPAGNVLVVDPDPPPGIERFLLATRFFAAGPDAKQPQGSFVTRWGDVRAVARAPLSGLETVGIIVRPDPAALTGVLVSFLVVGMGALAAALLLAWAAGWGITAPIQRLERNLDAFASDPESPATLAIVTDDEIGRLSGSFSAMEEAVRQAQQRVAELSRRVERETLLAKIAHEVRNPLFGIQATLSALELRLTGEAHREYFDVLRRETARISDLIDRMLESPASPVTATPIGEALPEVSRLVAARLPGRVVRVQLAGDGRLSLPLERELAVVLVADLCEGILRSAADDAAIELRLVREAEVVVLSVRHSSAASPAGDELLASCRARVETRGGTMRSTPAGDGRTVTELRFPAAAPALEN